MENEPRRRAQITTPRVGFGDRDRVQFRSSILCNFRSSMTPGAIRTLAAEAKTKRARAQWVRLELALVLVEATGRRIGAVRGLRWQDVATDPPSITWRKEFDKRRREQTGEVDEQHAR